MLARVARQKTPGLLCNKTYWLMMNYGSNVRFTFTADEVEELCADEGHVWS